MAVGVGVAVAVGVSVGISVGVADGLAVAVAATVTVAVVVSVTVPVLVTVLVVVASALGITSFSPIINQLLRRIACGLAAFNCATVKPVRAASASHESPARTI